MNICRSCRARPLEIALGGFVTIPNRGLVEPFSEVMSHSFLGTWVAGVPMTHSPKLSMNSNCAGSHRNNQLVALSGPWPLITAKRRITSRRATQAIVTDSRPQRARAQYFSSRAAVFYHILWRSFARSSSLPFLRARRSVRKFIDQGDERLLEAPRRHPKHRVLLIDYLCAFARN